MCNSGPMITDWIMVIITFIYVVATICILHANRTSAKATKMQVEEMKRQFEAENKPYITTELVYLKRSVYALRFTNHGKKIAEHVSFTFDQQFVEGLDEPFKGQIENQNGKECVIGIGQHYDIHLGTKKIRNDVSDAKGTIKYFFKDKEYLNVFDINVKDYITIFSTSSDEEDIIIQLKNQNKILEEIKEELRSMNTHNK